jgi:pimeloyl-ACP methyl ester carboxylesterase
MEERWVAANGLRFGILDTGPRDAPLVLCLHGFPDSAWTWRHLLPVLAERGYRGVAPFMRGYGPTDAPADGPYEVSALGRDACALHEALGGDERAALIGHDWGAAATYAAVRLEPERWSSFVTAAVPPTGHLALDLISPEQMRRSWYSYLFQLPVAEAVVAADGMAFVDRLWADWSPGYEAAADLALVKDALGSPERLCAAIRYYRDTPSELRAPSLSDSLPADKPFLYLHGHDDGCIGIDVLDAAAPFFPAGAEVEIVTEAGHFLHLEQPDRFNARVVAFLDAGTGRSAPHR